MLAVRKKQSLFADFFAGGQKDRLTFSGQLLSWRRSIQRKKVEGLMVFTKRSRVGPSSKDWISGNGKPTSNPIRILHIINDLSIGGAEMMLYKLLSRTDRKRFEPAVISLSGLDKLGEPIQKFGISVFPIR